MKFTVKQKIMAFGKQYRAFDESENQVYEIKSMLLSPERRKEVMDMEGNIVAWSEWPLMSRQASLSAGTESCTIAIPIMSIVPEWQGSQWKNGFSVKGDFFRMSFTVSEAGVTLATIVKRIIEFSDTYDVEVNETEFPKEFALLIAALIDHKYHSEENR